MQKQIKIGLVGLGQFGIQFFDLFYQHPAVKAMAICDLDATRFKPFIDKKSYGAKLSSADCYVSYESLLKSDVDAVAIFTQPWLHAPQCIQAMEAGKSVYSSVPVVMLPDPREILDWCDKLVTAVRKSGRHYMLGETTYYRPETMFCRRQAISGAFGNFVQSEGAYIHSFDSPACDLRDVNKARYSGKAGNKFLKNLENYRNRGEHFGPMLYPTHSVSGPMCIMNSRPLKVSCFGSKPQSNDSYFTTYNEQYGNQTALFRMDNGSIMTIYEHRESAAHADLFKVVGTDAYFQNVGYWHDCRNQENSRNISDEEMRNPLPDEVLQAYLRINEDATAHDGPTKNDFTGIFKAHGGSHPYLIHEFVDSVAHERKPEIDVCKAVRYMSAGAVAHQSARRDGDCLTIPDWGELEV